jgi:hypothetical protein
VKALTRREFFKQLTGKDVRRAIIEHASTFSRPISVVAALATSADDAGKELGQAITNSKKSSNK